MPRTEASRRVAITGIGCMSPNGVGRRAFWDALQRGRSGVRPISLFDPSDLPVRIAAEVAGFELERLVGRREAAHLPRHTGLAMAAAEEALADSKVELASMEMAQLQRMGVVLGSGGGPAEFTERQYRHYFAGMVRRASVLSIAHSTAGNCSSELSTRFGLRGPSHVLSTGCNSATDAIGYAAMLIAAGRCDVVLSGGTDAVITHGIVAGFCLMKALTRSWNDQPERASRPFSADRDGFVLGEGAWVFVLEELEHALGRGAYLYAQVVGYGSTCDAHHRVRLDESGEEPARAIRQALEEARVGPSELDYVNLHGSATLLNDRVETRAIKKALGREASRIPMSGTKSLIGHPQGACGAAGLAAALFALEEQWLPPTLNLEQPDPECDLDYVPLRSRPGRVQVALVNTIGFGSKNSALVVRSLRG